MSSPTATGLQPGTTLPRGFPGVGSYPSSSNGASEALPVHAVSPPPTNPLGVDLGVSVATLTIDSIQLQNNPDWGTVYYQLEVKLVTTDPLTGTTFTNDQTYPVPTSCNPCGGLVFPLAFPSNSAATVTIFLWDNQQPLSCDCQVFINGNQNMYSVQTWGSFYSSSPPPCSYPTGCSYWMSGGNSGSRTATISDQLTVDTALLANAVGRLDAYTTELAFINALSQGSNGWPILCPSASTFGQPFSAQYLGAVLIGVLQIVLLGNQVVGSTSTIGADMLQAFVNAVIHVAGDIVPSWLSNFLTWLAQYYPNYLSNINGLTSPSSYVSNPVNCANTQNFWLTGGMGFVSQGSNYPPISTFISDLGTLIGYTSSEINDLLSGKLSSAVAGMNAEYNFIPNVQTDLSTIEQGLAQVFPPGPYVGSCVLYNNQGTCQYVAENLYYNVLDPFKQMLGYDRSLLSSDISTLNDLSAQLGVQQGNCGLPAYLEEGASYKTNLQAQYGIGPTYAASVSGASWLSVSPTGSSTFTLSGTAPSSYWSGSVTLTLYDSAGDSSTCTNGVTVGFNPQLSVSPSTVTVSTSSVTFSTSVTGGPQGGSFSYTYYNLPTGCSSLNQASFSCTPNQVGTFTIYVTVTDKNGYAIGSSGVTLTVKPGATYTATFSESGLPSGDTWSVSVGSSGKSGSAGSTITFTGLSGSYSYSVGEVIVSANGCVIEYYSPSPSGGTISGATHISVKYTFEESVPAATPTSAKCIPVPADSPATSLSGVSEHTIGIARMSASITIVGVRTSG